MDRGACRLQSLGCEELDTIEHTYTACSSLPGAGLMYACGPSTMINSSTVTIKVFLFKQYGHPG